MPHDHTSKRSCKYFTMVSVNFRAGHLIIIRFLAFSLLIASLIFLNGCQSCNRDTQIATEPIVTSITDKEAVGHASRMLDEVSPIISDGFEISLWAPEQLLSDPVQLYMDHKGRAWVSTTSRRRTSVPDIRRHREWMTETLTWQTVEDRRDFLRKELAPERSDDNSWLEDFNGDGSHDWRDLNIEKEPVFLLEDRSGNGLADHSTKMNWDFYDEITDIGGAVTYHERSGDMYFGLPPDVWRIRDTNGDGVWNAPESISHGYGVHIGYGGHGMSGLITGPDGRIYWSIGDVGLNVTDQDGKKWAYPGQGVIVRSEPDGSNFEVFASGLRNTHEFTFDKYGNLITVDNDGDHAGEHERIVYLINGSDTGWRINWQFNKYNDPKNNEYKVWMDEGYYKERFDDQAAHILPPITHYINGPSGMVYNPGTALDEKWKEHFFVAEFKGSTTNSGIHAFSLKESGASFTVDNEQHIMEGILATGLSFGPDGALYFADWIEGWEVKNKGRIWKMDTPSGAGSSIRVETQKLLAENFRDLTSNELLQHLAHADMRVRQKAQFELAGRSDSDSFLQALRQTDHQLMRIHGIWGLAQIGRRNSDRAAPLVDLLTDDDSEVRAQAAKMLGDVRFEPAGEALTLRLQDENDRVRFFAAEALGRLSYGPAVEHIVKMLEDNDDEDVYLRQGGAIALARIGNTDALTGLADHPSRSVRIAAVVALHRLGNPGVARFLNDEDEYIVTNAARAINDDAFIEEALDDLAVMIAQDRFTGAPLLRRAINANLFVGKAENAQMLADFLQKSNISEDLKIEALNTLSVWPEPSVLDRVTGVYRGQIRNNVEDVRRSLEPVIVQFLGNQQSNDMKLVALKAVENLQLLSATNRILELVADDTSAAVRMTSLQTLAALDYNQIENVINIALEDDHGEVRMNALSLIPKMGLQTGATVEMIDNVLNSGTAEEQKMALHTLGVMNNEASYRALNRQMDRLVEGEMEPEIQLEFILAVEAVNSQSLHQRLRNYEDSKIKDDWISVFRESLYGGDAAEGRRIFYGHEGAQCIRCHTDEGNGGEVGPNLTGVANRISRRQILQSMVDPSARIAPGYGMVTVTLHNGETISGVVATERDSHITITRGDRQWDINKSDIARQEYSPSAMPTMREILSRSELRDLVAYLSTLDISENQAIVN